MNVKDYTSFQDFIQKTHMSREQGIKHIIEELRKLGVAV